MQDISYKFCLGRQRPRQDPEAEDEEEAEGQPPGQRLSHRSNREDCPGK